MEMKEATVLVTGASRGIGKAIALAFAKAGAKAVLVNDVSGQQDVAEETVLAIKSLGVQSEKTLWDVSDFDATQSASKEIVSRFGGVDVLVNNAGITRDQLFIRMDESQWDKVFAVNAKSVFNCSKAFLPGMLKKRYGRIVCISSVVAFSGNAGQTNYSASKAAIVGFMKSLAVEYASRGITVNAVAPGFIDTGMTKQIPDKFRDGLIAKIPLGRIGLPEDVANAVLFLAQPEACYITGQVLHVNGGLYL